MKNQCYGILLATLLICCTATAGFALSGQPLAEFQDFVKNLREEKRVDRLGYLIFVQLPVTKTSTDRVLSYSGKFFYACEDGYLTHVNYSRLERIQKAQVRVRVLDKKRLDDTREAWYLVWVENDAEAARLKARFEPLYRHEHTCVIRIRAEDEAFLQEQKMEYSLLDEHLLPLKVQPMGKVAKITTPDPVIADLITQVTGENLASSVLTLQNFQTRYVKEKGNFGAVAWLKEEFEKIGGMTVTTPECSPSYAGSANIVAIKEGEKDPQSVYVVCGHMDSTVSSYSNKKNAPGADDNGSGSAGVLELARVLGKLRFPETIIFVCFNAEEVGLVGSKAYARTLANTADLKIKAVFNMDMIADRDDNEVAVIGNTKSNWLIDVFKNAAELYTGLKSNTQYNSNIWYSDHSSFWNIGASAILTIEGYPEMSAHYHSTRDLLENMSVTFMERIARSNLAALLTLNAPIVEMPRTR